jgi:hypothetical protein
MSDEEDWTTVTQRRRPERTPDQEAEPVEVPKKRVEAESIQALIKKRIQLSLPQEKADQLCSFPPHTIRNIESHCVLPTAAQQSVIQKQFGVQLKIITLPS